MAASQLKGGVILSYINLLIGNLIPFFYTPVMLDILGQAENGLYGIANSVMGYISLLNFGIGSAIVRYLAKYRAQGDAEGERRVIGLFLKAYGVIAVLILSAGIFVSFHLDGYGRSLTPEELDKLAVLVRLMTLNTAVFVPFSVFSSITIAHERYIFNKIVNIFTTVAGPLLNLVMLFAGFGSVGLVATSTIINFGSYLVYTWYSVRRLKIVPSFRPCPPGLLREILVFSGFAFLGSVVDMLYWSTGKLIIGWGIGAAAVSVYNVGANFNSYITNLSTAVSGVLTPRIAEIVEREKDMTVLSELFIKVGRLQFLVISFILSAFIVFGRVFLHLWVGPGYAEAYPVALLTMVPVAVPLIQNTGLNILYVLNRHRFRSVVYLCIALLNVLLSFLWVEKYGIVGVAAATGLSYVVGNICIINWYYYRRIGLNIPKFWANILRMAPQMAVFILAGLAAVPRLGIGSWIEFLTAAAVYTALYLPLAYLFMMNRYERELCLDLLKKAGRRLKKRGSLL